MKIKLNPDQEIVNTIREGLKRTRRILSLPQRAHRGDQMQANAALDVLQVVPLRIFALFPDDVRQHGVPDLSGRCGCCVPAGGH